MKRLIIHLTLLMILIPARAQQTGNQNYTAKIEQIRDFITRQMKLDHIPGLSLAFYIDDFTWAEGFGYADLENKVPATPHSSYRLASNTKSMTALAAMQLSEAGKLDLDADIRNYVPWFPRKHWTVTSRQLMGHLGGVSHYRDPDTESHIKVHKDTRESLDIFDDFQLVYEPGTRYLYSSYGYNLLGAVVEVAAGEPYGKYLNDHIWKPLGMNETCMDSPDNLIPNRVRGYRLIYGELKNSEFVDMSSRFAAGGTRSTVLDLLKYARSYETGQILSKEGILRMETSLATRDGHYTDYGMGWRITPVNGHFIAMHTGSQNETRTILIRIPGSHAAIALAYNFEGASTYTYGRRIYQILFDEPWNLPVYTRDEKDKLLWEAIWNVYNYGLARVDRYGKAMTESPDKTAEAFTWFNGCVDSDSLEINMKHVRQKIQNGRHPAGNTAFVKLGSFMAGILKGHVDYHKAGAPVFFADYIRYYRAHLDIPESFRFQPAFEKVILEWESIWEKTWTPEIRRAYIAPWSDPVTFLRNKRKLWKDAPLLPDFTAQISATAMEWLLEGKVDDAIRLAGATAEVYPEIALPAMIRSFSYFSSGEETKGIAAFRQAQQAKADGFSANAGQFVRYARTLVSLGRLNKALKLLESGENIFPEASSIHEAQADILREISRRTYRKALEENPGNQRVWKKLKKAG